MSSRRVTLIINGYIKELKRTLCPLDIINLCIGYYGCNDSFSPKFKVMNWQNVHTQKLKISKSKISFTTEKTENIDKYRHLYAISNSDHKLLVKCDPGYHKELYFSIQIAQHTLPNNIKIGIAEHDKYNCKYAYLFNIDHNLQRFVITKHLTFYGSRSHRNVDKIIFKPNNKNYFTHSESQILVTIKLDVNQWKLHVYYNNSETISIKVKPNINYTPIISFNHADNKSQVTAEIVTCHSSVIKDTQCPVIYDPHHSIIHATGNTYGFLKTDCRDPKTILSLLWKGQQLIDLSWYQNLTELIKEIKYLSQDSKIISRSIYQNGHSTPTSIKMNAFDDGCDEFNQYAVDLWIYIEIYQYFKKQFYELVYSKCSDIQSKHQQIIPIIMDYLMYNLDNDYKQYTANDNEYLKEMIQLYTHKNNVWYRKIDEKFIDCFKVIHPLNNIDKKEKIEIINVIASYMMDCFTGKNIQTAKLITGYQFTTSVYSVIDTIPRDDSFHKWMDRKVIPELKDKMDGKCFLESEYNKLTYYDEKCCRTKWDPYWDWPYCCRHGLCGGSYVYQCDPWEVCVFPDKTVNLWENEYIKKKFNDKREKISKHRIKIKRKMKKLKAKRKRQNWVSYLKKKSYI